MNRLIVFSLAVACAACTEAIGETAEVKLVDCPKCDRRMRPHDTSLQRIGMAAGHGRDVDPHACSRRNVKETRGSSALQLIFVNNVGNEDL